MTDDDQGNSTGDAAGDPVGALLLGFAAQIDQLAALIGGSRTPGEIPGAGSQLTGLVEEVGGLLIELGDLLARLLSAFIAILEAIAEMLRSPSGEPSATAAPFEAIPVRITSTPAHP